MQHRLPLPEMVKIHDFNQKIKTTSKKIWETFHQHNASYYYFYEDTFVFIKFKYIKMNNTFRDNYASNYTPNRHLISYQILQEP